MAARKTYLDHVDDTLFLLGYFGISGATRYVFGVRLQSPGFSIRVIASKRYVTQGEQKICLVVAVYPDRKSTYAKDIRAEYMPPYMELLIRDLILNLRLADSCPV
jgi:hypothetical protein